MTKFTKIVCVVIFLLLLLTVIGLIDSNEWKAIFSIFVIIGAVILRHLTRWRK